MKKLLPILVGIPFTAYSSYVVVTKGYFGFVTLSLQEPWAMQLLLDLFISVFLIGSWIRKDAPKHGISALPYLVALPFLGSMATLAYFAHRGLKGERALETASAES